MNSGWGLPAAILDFRTKRSFANSILNDKKGVVIVMSLGVIFEQAGIPLLLFVICMYYGIRLIIMEDASSIRGKNKEPLRDEKAYAKEGGKLLIFYGVATLVMAILIFVNLYVAVGEIIVCTLILGVLWKRMNDKYGA